MRKHELENCPQWLLDADTENENVVYDSFNRVIWLSGDFRGGDFWSGNFRGGNFLGGNFRGGNFLGGNFRGGNFLGGDFLGGNFLGGDFLGGDFLGGDFWSGNFRSGDFRSGNFWGGDFRSGNFWSGNFWGGNFRGGNFRGGNFLGGNFRGGNFWGDKLTHKPISIYGLTWPVLITGKQMQIGCQRHTHEKWAGFSDSEINRMERRAAEFWRVNKQFLLSICDHEALLTKIALEKAEQ